MPKAAIPFDHSYARDLLDLSAPCRPALARSPQLLYFNHDLAEELRLDLSGHATESLAALFSGNALPEGTRPIAQAYAGHQFGQFNPQLGDGRALLIGEVIDRYGQRRDLVLKGAGRTPFSRRGDGKAAVGPMLREALLGEAMHALGIPTTRALAVVATGEPVYREQTLPGAILTRVAASHLRVGTFQYVTAHGTAVQMRRLADYAIARHYPEWAGTEDRYLGFLRAVAERQAKLVAQWMHTGFIHGVMNTDNVAISGETLDFGPCAFIETYDPQAVFSSIDEGGRYAYGAQPRIAHWNLARLAETLLPLFDANEDRAISLATRVVDDFADRYQHYWLAILRAKLGLQGQAEQATLADRALGESWLDLLQAQRIDFTLAWRHLAEAAVGNDAPLRSLFAGQPGLGGWLQRWRERCAAEDAGEPGAAQARAMRMGKVNPWIVARNHHVEQALAAASDAGNLLPFEQLLHALQKPFDPDPANARYAEPAPQAFMANFRTFCGT
jgi:uncharacterized protein YdiU (UPF0061 family)